MKRNLLSSCILLGLAVIVTFNATAQDWTKKKSSLGGPKDRDGAVYFELNGKVYVGGGFYSKDFLEYDPATDKWTVKAPIEGVIRSRFRANGFSANGKGYIAFGSDVDVNFEGKEKNDVWEYDPAGNKWTKKADCPGIGRSYATSFVINNKAYFIGGYDDNDKKLNEVWEYTPASNSWKQKKNFPENEIISAMGFSINGKGYIVGGSTATGVYSKSTYEYDPVADSWKKRADFPGEGRSAGVGFAIGSKGFCGLGSSVANMQYIYHKDFYMYDPSADSWGPAINNFPAAARQHLVAAVVGVKAYVGLGWTFISGIAKYFDDWYEFTHPTVNIASAPAEKQEISVYPNPATTTLFVRTGNTLNHSHFAIYNITGQRMIKGQLPADKRIDIGSFPTGQYFIELITEKQSAKQFFSIIR